MTHHSSRRAALAAVAVLALACARPAHAHHAFAAEFDGNKPVTLKGTVTKIQLINPHSWLHITVKDAKTGAATPWRIEMGAPNQLLRRGWNSKALPPGTEVIVQGYAAKNGSKMANGGTITFGDGRKITVSFFGTGAPGDPK
jgi:hypothetical protein